MKRLKVITVVGNVTIGHHTAISLGANIIDGVTIGERNLRRGDCYQFCSGV